MRLKSSPEDDTYFPDTDTHKQRSSCLDLKRVLSACGNQNTVSICWHEKMFALQINNMHCSPTGGSSDNRFNLIYFFCSGGY